MGEPGAASVVSSPDRRRAGVAAAAAVSVFAHVAVLAAAVHLSDTAPVSVENSEVAVAVEIVAMSPEPGGEDHAATAGIASAEVADGPGAQDDAAAADVEAEIDPETTPETADEMETVAEAEAADADADTVAMPEAEEETETEETETEGEAETAALTPPPEASDSVAESITPEPFETPTRRPVVEPARRQPRAPERALPPPPRPAEHQAVSEKEQQPQGAGSDGGSDGSAVADMVAHAGGKGDGLAGAVPGPRFRPGAPGNPLPAYPEAARRWGYEGRVVVAVRVSAAGKPLAADVAESSGYRILDQAAARTIRRWRFRPAGAGGDVAVIMVPVSFRLED